MVSLILHSKSFPASHCIGMPNQNRNGLSTVAQISPDQQLLQNGFCTQTSLNPTLRSYLDNYFLVLVLNILMNYSDYFGVVATEVQGPVEAWVVVLALKIPHHWIPKK